jgi:uroporphyrinogen decarboxylase
MRKGISNMVDGPNFNRILKAFRLEGEPDRVPLAELGVAPSIMSEILGRPFKTTGDRIEFFAKMGYDYVKLSPIVNMNPANIRPQGEKPKEISVAGAVDRDWAPEGAGMITNREEFERYVWPRPEEISYRMLDEPPALLPDGMGGIAQYGDIFTLTWELMGFETFSYALIDQPDLVEDLWNTIGELVYGMFEKMASYDFVGALWYSDDIAYQTGLLVSPRVLRKYHFPWVKKIGDLARARNIPFIYHTDGILWDVMEDLIGCGVGVLHPIEPQAMDIREVKRRYGDRLCLMGNLDLSGPLTRGTPEEVEQEVKRLLREVAPGGGYCLGSGNSVPDYVPVKNYIAMTRACLKYGKYPIQC